MIFLYFLCQLNFFLDSDIGQQYRTAVFNKDDFQSYPFPIIQYSIFRKKRKVSDSVAKRESVEPKLFGTWSRNRSRNSALKKIYSSQFGECSDEEKPPLRRISYGTT